MEDRWLKWPQEVVVKLDIYPRKSYISSIICKQPNFICTLHLLHFLYVHRYISTKPHRAQRKEELDIFGREFMFILDREGIWFYVEVLRSGKRGLVPTKSIVKFKPMDQTE